MKDIYIDEYERLLAIAEERGLPPDQAEAYAEARAYGAMQERIADMFDEARACAKYGE